MTLTVTDLFCGAGGSSLGAEAAGLELVMAANHWQTAIEVHQAHFPEAGHDCADISQADPRRYPRTDILLASPECFTAGHMVTTEHGQVPIESITVGTLVLTHEGRWRPVVRVQHRQADTVIVKGQGHTGIETTALHRFWVKPSERRWDNSMRDYRRVYDDPCWIAAEHLLTNQALWATPVRTDSVPDLQPPAAFGPDPSAAWWLVGRWLGDGSLTFGRNHEVEISCGFHEVDELRERLADSGWSWRESTKRTATTFAIGNATARDWLSEHCGRGAGGKQVPSAALCLRRADREALLEGYLSADGNRTQRRVRCSTVSRALAVSVRLLAESLGHRVAMAHDKRTTYTIEGRTGVARMQWILHWEPTLSTKRSPEAFVDGDHAWSRVRLVTEGRDDVTVYNIEVEGDHSYVLDGIVVANCTNHSQARGVSRQRQDPTLWDAPDPSAERSRATMWDVPRFAEQMRYAAVVVENVVEATKWVMWPAWWQAMELLGYRGQVLSHNSMHHGVPQSRDRIYVVWARAGLDVDLEMEHAAWCPRCDLVRPVRQAWKNGRTVGRYRRQWLWACISCGTAADPAVRGAVEIIDWDLPTPRIGDRKRPLADATRARILAGLQRYGWAPITTTGAGNVHERTPGNRARGLDEPLPVQQTTSTHALATPPGFLYQPAHGGRVVDLGQPHPTVCASDDRHALVVTARRHHTPKDSREPLTTLCAGGTHHALVVPLTSTGRARPSDEPLPTLVTTPRPGLLMRNNIGGAEMVTPLDEPARTMTTKGHQSLLVPYNGNGQAVPAAAPLGTQPTKDRWSLIDVEQVVDDCGFRMLEPHEIAAAMAFPVGYIPSDLTKKDRVKLAGNAVTPPVMQWIAGRIAQALEAA
jgi:site-specific DNA-cytosine methylase